jgi:hypothetical protein
MHGLSHDGLGLMPAWHLFGRIWRDEAGDVAVINHRPAVRYHRAVVCSASVSASSKLASPSSTNGYAMFNGWTMHTTD